MKKPTKKTEPKDQLAQLKAENKKLVEQNDKLRDMLSLIVKTWRDQDAKYAEKCYDICRKATCLFLEIGERLKKQ